MRLAAWTGDLRKSEYIPATVHRIIAYFRCLAHCRVAVVPPKVGGNDLALPMRLAAYMVMGS